MATLQQMREERESISAELVSLQNDSEGRKWLPEDQTKYDDLMGKHDDVVSRIKRQEKINDLTAMESPKLHRDEQKELADKPMEAKALYNKWVRNGWDGMTHDEILKVRNTMSTTTTTEGGYTVQSEVSSDLMEKLEAYGGMREVSQVLRTAKGNPISWPTTDGTAEVGEIIAENTTATDLDIAFGTVSMSVFKYSSKVVTVPFELLQDSEINVEALVNARIGERLARITNTHFTTGSGSGAPRGVVVGSTEGATAASATAITHGELIDLYHSVDPAYRASATWMMNDDSIKLIRQLEDANNRPLYWSDSGNLADSLGTTLLGRSVTINQDMATAASATKPILFGDFSKYIIRDVMEVTLFRFTDSAYTKKGQVGFMAWMRTGGNYTDNGASMMHLLMA